MDLGKDDVNRIDQVYGLDQKEDAIQEDGAVKIFGALGEVIARKILFFSTFEDMQFQMRGLTV